MAKREIKVRNINDKATDYYFIGAFTYGADKYLKQTYGNPLKSNSTRLDGKYVLHKDELDNFPAAQYMQVYGFGLTDKFSDMTIKEFLEKGISIDSDDTNREFDYYGSWYGERY